MRQVNIIHFRMEQGEVLMDKVKSGKLIKEARIQKNYTQSELAYLLGVSNKAVSHWELGESFPDIGILENLASILDVSIQDIIFGEKENNDDSVAKEIVRVVLLQQREKKRKVLSSSMFAVILLSCVSSGFSAMGRKGFLLINDTILGYILLMIFSFSMMVVISISENTINNRNKKYEKYVKIVALSSLLLSIAISFGTYIIACYEPTLFVMDSSHIGPFINWQFIGLFILNTVIFIFTAFMYEERVSSIHWGSFACIATMYLAVLYGDLLHRIGSIQGVLEELIIRLLIVIAMFGISLIVIRILKKNRE